MNRQRFADRRGFTLIELIVVIVIVGILSALGGKLIMKPVTGYVDLARRTRLVDQAEMALRRMQRDIRQALSNSIRVDASGQYLEMLSTVGGGRYRRYPDPLSGGNVLDFTTADTGFDILGYLGRTPVAGDQLVIYNVAVTGSSSNAYAAVPDNRATVGAGSDQNNIVLAPAFQFGNMSPQQRFYIVDQPISYACESGNLNRYDGYSISSEQPTTSLAGEDLVATGVNSCRFSYDPGASQRAGLVTLQLSLSEAGETITLLHQIHVISVP